MKRNHYYLVICSHFTKEAEIVLEKLNYSEVELISLLCCCVSDKKSDEDNQISYIKEIAENNGNILMLTCRCINPIKKIISKYKNVENVSLNVPFYMLTNKTVIDEMIYKRCHLLTPSWLQNWHETVIDKWQFSEKTASDFFSETADKFVLLDTGVYDDSSAKLKELSEFTKTPYEIRTVGLDFMTYFLQSTISDWLNKIQKRKNINVISTQDAKLANYAMIFDLISKMNVYRSKEEVINQIFDTVQMLFGAEYIIYAGIRDGIQIDYIKTFGKRKITKKELFKLNTLYQDDFFWSDDINGFFLRLRIEDEAVGFIVAENIYFPEYKDKYMNFLPLIGSVAALSVSNSEKYEKLKETEEKLFQEKEYLYATLYSIGEGAVVTDADGKINMMNPPAQKITGWEKNRSNEKYFSDLFTILESETKKPVESPIKQVMRLKHTVKNKEDVVLISKKGKQIDIVFTASPILKGSSIAGVIIVFNDITSRKETERKLIQAKELAERANRLKSEFLANISHEIRTPMNGIMGFTEIMETTDLSTEQLEYLKLIKDSATSLLELINTLLDLASIEAGKTIIIEKIFNIRKVIETTIAPFFYVADKKRIQISYIIDDNIPKYVKGDEGKFIQILNNLINNAVKFTESGSVSIKAACGKKPAADRMRLFFTISDTGIGIPDNRIDEVFEPFTQADGSHTRKFGGTGLGLTITKKLIEMLGGSIEVESCEGAGTRFDFNLYFAAADGKDIEKSFKNIALDIDPASIKMEVLIVEDEEINSILLRKLVENLGHTAVLTKNGLEALQLLKERYFDIILTDIQMPIMDGLTLTEKIRNGEAGGKNKKIPIIALTAFAMKTDREKFISSGITDYISKPLKKAELIEIFIKYSN